MLIKVLSNYPNGLSKFVVGSPLELEHALIMLLLLMGLLVIHGKYQRYAQWVILGGVALSLFTPKHILNLDWSILSAIILPPLLWQVAIRLASVRPTFSLRSLTAWLLTIIFIGFALFFGSKILLASALLIGNLAASLIWQVREHAIGSSDLGTFGQLVLAMLLVEVDVAVHPLGPFLGILFSSAAFGLLLGFVGIRLAPYFPSSKVRNLFYLGLIYFAYLTGVIMNFSGITTALMTGLVVATYSFSVGLWPIDGERPAPLDQGWVFVIMAGTWLLLGWQAHVPLTVNHIQGIGFVLIATALSVFVSRRLVPMSEANAHPKLRSLLRKEGKVFLLVFGVLLLWPQEAVLTFSPLAVALLAALVIIFTLRILIYQVFDMAGIKIRWPDE